MVTADSIDGASSFVVVFSFLVVFVVLVVVVGDFVVVGAGQWCPG